MLEHWRELWTLRRFLLLPIKMDRSGEESRDMVTLLKKDMLRKWVCNAAKDGWCADWACVAQEPKVTSVQHMGGDEDAVYLEQKNIFTETDNKRPCYRRGPHRKKTSETVYHYDSGVVWLGVGRCQQDVVSR